MRTKSLLHLLLVLFFSFIVAPVVWAAAGVTITPTSLSVSEDGVTDTYSIVLDEAPGAAETVTVTISVADDQATVDGLATTVVTFDASNWNVPKEVTVAAVDDGYRENGHTSTINHAVSSSDSGSVYEGLVADPVTVNITDNDNKIRLTSMCSLDPDTVRIWRVRNENSVDAPVDWQVVGTAQAGSILAPANSDVFFSTDAVGGANTTKISVNGIDQDVKASGGSLCSTPPVEFAGSSSTVAERPNTTQTVDVQLSAPYLPLPQAVTFSVTISAGTAISGTDYTFSPQTVTFPAGLQTATESLSLPTLPDTLLEGSETVELALTYTGGLPEYLGTTLTHIVTINDAPVLDLNGPEPNFGYSSIFTATHGPVPIVDRAALTVNDSDDAQLESATITLLNRPDGAAEQLAADTAGTAISAGYDPSIGILSLTGSDSLANYQQVLRSLTYANSSGTPDAATRTIEVIVRDARNSSNTATTTVTIEDKPGSNPSIHFYYFPIMGKNAVH